MPGSSALTSEQQDWYERRFGERFVAVQEQPLRPSRRVRRGRATRQDLQVLRAQQDGQRQLRQASVTPL